MPGKYIFGSSPDEQSRLRTQGKMLAELSRTFFASAGITHGMRVLDVGCGVGSSTLLLAELVGPTGHVVALDCDPGQLDAARAECRSLFPRGPEFVEADLECPLPSLEYFDAVVGRFVLAYLSDLREVLARLRACLAPCGFLAFQEWDHSRLPDAYPRLDRYDRLNQCLIQFLEQSGVRTRLIHPLTHAQAEVAGVVPHVQSMTYLSADVDRIAHYLEDTAFQLLRNNTGYHSQGLRDAFSPSNLNDFVADAKRARAVLGLSPIVGCWTPPIA